jgi:hypothetical protein
MVSIFLAFYVFLLNIPFGYWGKGTKKMSFNWFLAIHLPIFLSIFLRFAWNIETNWKIIVIFIIMFMAGQYTGKNFCMIKPLFIKLHCGT